MRATIKIGKRQRGIRRGFTCGAALLIWVGLFLGGCATFTPEKPSVLVLTDRGTVVYKDEYEFARPSPGWLLLQAVEAGDFELGFARVEKGAFPSQTTFIYDGEPFGNYRDLDRRAEQYCTRFLFNSGMFPQISKKEKTQVMGQSAVALYLDGENPNRNEKAKSKIYLIQKGERIISFVCTQWRPLQGSFDPEPFEHFERFVRSFKFLKPDFYEELNDRIKRSKG